MPKQIFIMAIMAHLHQHHLPHHWHIKVQHLHSFHSLQCHNNHRHQCSRDYWHDTCTVEFRNAVYL